MRNITSLFKHLSNINRAYEIVKKSSNEDFNIFSILRMETDEVNTHSRFIAELLNPKGIHFQGEVFLELFIKYFNYLKKTEDNSNFLGAPIELNPRKSIIEVEKYIAPKTEKEGGRLDIALKVEKTLSVLRTKYMLESRKIKWKDTTTMLKKQLNNIIFSS